MKARFFALAALVLGLASCQQEFNGAAPVGGEVDFQLKVDAKELATRAGKDGAADTQNAKNSAFGAIDYYQGTDWKAVDLRYTLEVFDANANYASNEVSPVKDRQVLIVDEYTPVTFDLRLVPNREYRFVVFADFVPDGTCKRTDLSESITDQAALGLHHTIGSDLRDIKVKEDKDAINDESTDAYFASEVFKITNSAAKDIVLRRPYGKVRVIATDLAELNINVDPGKVIVTYEKGHVAAFNAVTGAIDKEERLARVVYENAYATEATKMDLSKHYYNDGYDSDEKATNANGVERHTHMTLFTDYILADNDQEPVHFTMTVEDKGGKEIKTTHFSTDIPVQRNHLTTVIGNVLTTATEINVTIEDSFEGNYNLNLWDGSVKKPEVVGGAYAIYEAAELAWVAQQVNDKTNPKTFKGETVKLCKDIHLNGEAWTPIGANGKFEGTFDGQNHVIEGLFVNMTDKTPAGLFANAKYVMNLKVCHAEVYGHYKSAVIVGDGLCSRISNCDVENATVVVTPLNEDYGNHVGAIVGYLSAENEAYVMECSVKNVTITAFRDVAAIVGTATASKNNKPTIKKCHVEGATITANQLPAYKEGDKDGNAGVIVGRITNASASIEECTEGEGNIVNRIVNSTKELEYAVADAKDGDTIYVDGEVVMPYFTGKTLNFEGVQKSAIIKQSPATHIDTHYTGATLNFKGVTLVGESYKGDTQGYQKAVAETYEDCHFVNYIMFAGENTTVNNCTFANEGQYFWTGTAKNITFNNCVFDAKERAVKVCTVGNHGERTATFNKCTFSADTQNKAAIEVDGSKGSSYKVYINECTETGFAEGEFTGHSMFNVEGANVELYLDGLKWIAYGRFVDEDGNVCVYNVEGLQAAVDAAVDGDTIKVIADIEGDVTVAQKAGVEITIDGNNHNYKGVIVVDGKSATYTTAGLTIKNLNFNADKISADACIRLGNNTNATRYTCNVTVEGCTFDVKDAVGVKSYTGGDKNLTIKGCTAKVGTHSLLQAKGIDGILVEGCTVESKNGLNFNNSTNVEVKSSNVEVKGYAVRFGEGSAADAAAEAYTIVGSTLKSACADEGDAVIVLRGTAANATLNIENTTIEGTRQIINNTNAKVFVDGAIVASNATALNDAIAAGNDAYLLAGEYTMPSVAGKELTISGSRDVVITVNKPNMSGSDITFEGVTVKGSGTYTGVQHVNTVTYNNVKVIGEMCLYGEKVEFNNCEFELNNQYIWTYGCKDTTFEKCVFNTNGKAILVYNEGNGGCKVAVNNCTFKASAQAFAGAIKNQCCAAIEIDNHQNSGVGAAHNVTTDGNTYESNFSGEWRIKNFVAGNAITVNGVAYEQIAIDGKFMTIDANKNVTVL